MGWGFGWRDPFNRGRVKTECHTPFKEAGPLRSSWSVSAIGGTVSSEDGESVGNRGIVMVNNDLAATHERSVAGNKKYYRRTLESLQNIVTEMLDLRPIAITENL